MKRKRRRTWARRAALGAVAYIGLSYAGAWFVFHPITRPVRVTRDLGSLRPRDVEFRSADGVRLSGWWFAGEKAAATIILCHGAFENRMAMRDCVPHLARAGYGVLTFDFRARGKSGGDRSTLGFEETEDLLAAVRWVRDQPQAADMPVGVMGFSQGAAATIMAAARCSDIDAILADSAYATLDRSVAAHERVFFGPFASSLGLPFHLFGMRMAGFAPATVRPVDVIGDIAPRPILLIQGERDFMTPPANARLLAAAAGANTSLWIVPGARHTKARRKHPGEYWERVLEFWEGALTRNQDHVSVSAGDDGAAD